ncbi:MAG: ATP phosphoribosyltransferase regulatory subunit [Oscillospiraceae bacterium]|nr:ATP phosphoribosyltransferase regulatory subunit [Oscillospiraceae bacterium]
MSDNNINAKSKLLLLPDGMRDIVYDEALLYDGITGGLSALYEKSGYKRIITPSIEYYDAFGAACHIASESMYKFTENNGNLVVLRADNTTPIARVAATKLASAAEISPQRLCYSQSIFRANSDYTGRRSEMLQSGVEIIGESGMKADLLCISTALDALASLGLDYKLEIGHVGLYNALVENLALSEEEKRVIRKYVERKNFVSLNFTADEKLKSTYEIIKRIPLLFGTSEVFEEAAAVAGDNIKAVSAIDYARDMYDILCAAGYADNILLDFGIVHEIDYYSGIVFRGYVEGAAEAVLRGGRYDGFIKNFDRDLCATGFAVNVCLVADAMKKLGRTPKYAPCDVILHFDASGFFEAKKLFEKLTSEGRHPEYSKFDDVKSTAEYALLNGIPDVAVISGGKVSYL